MAKQNDWTKPSSTGDPQGGILQTRTGKARPDLSQDTGVPWLQRYR